MKGRRGLLRVVFRLLVLSVVIAFVAAGVYALGQTSTGRRVLLLGREVPGPGFLAEGRFREFPGEPDGPEFLFRDEGQRLRPPFQEARPDFERFGFEGERFGRDFERGGAPLTVGLLQMAGAFFRVSLVAGVLIVVSKGIGRLKRLVPRSA